LFINNPYSIEETGTILLVGIILQENGGLETNAQFPVS